MAKEKSSVLSQERELLRIMLKAIEAARGDIPVATVIKKAGMKRQQWYRIMKGESGTSLKTIKQMAEAVGKDPEELVKDAFRIFYLKYLADSDGDRAAAIVGILSPDMKEHAMAALEAFKVLSTSQRDENGKEQSGERPESGKGSYVNGSIPKDEQLEEPIPEDLNDDAGTGEPRQEQPRKAAGKNGHA